MHYIKLIDFFNVGCFGGPNGIRTRDSRVWRVVTTELRLFLPVIAQMCSTCFYLMRARSAALSPRSGVPQIKARYSTRLSYGPITPYAVVSFHRPFFLKESLMAPGTGFDPVWQAWQACILGHFQPPSTCADRGIRPGHFIVMLIWKATIYKLVPDPKIYFCCMNELFLLLSACFQ